MDRQSRAYRKIGSQPIRRRNNMSKRKLKELIEELEQAELFHQELKNRFDNMKEDEKIDLGLGLQTKEEVKRGLQFHQHYIGTLKVKIAALSK